MGNEFDEKNSSYRIYLSGDWFIYERRIYSQSLVKRGCPKRRLSSFHTNPVLLQGVLEKAYL